MELRGLLVSCKHEVVLVIVKTIALASGNDHVAEVVSVDDLERSNAMSREGLEIVLGLIEVVVAYSRVGVVLGRLAIHLEGFDICTISLAVKAIVDDGELRVILLILQH